MVFAGDLPEGSMVQLVKANFDKPIDAACLAAELGQESWKGKSPALALVISCVG